MTETEAKDIMTRLFTELTKENDVLTDDERMAFNMAITALELMDTLIDRPCSACRYHKENGCCRWNCVFDGHIGKKVSKCK